MEQAGEWIFRNCDLGTWKIEARLSGQYATKNVEIKEDGQLVRYHVTLSYWQATITVTYPAGAVCTCSKGTTELTAPDTSGSHVFTVDEPGDWTVEATQWDDSSSEIVTVTDQNGAEYTIEVDFVTYLYNNGDDNFTLTGGWVIWSGNVTKDAESIRLLDGTTRAIIGTKNKIDLTPYSILSVKITDRSGSGGNEDKLGADSVTDHYKNPIVGTEIFGTGVTSVDISNCNRSLYVFVGSSRNGNDGRITFTEVWLK